MLDKIQKKAAANGFPVSLDMGNGVKAEAYNGRGFDRAGYAVYIYTGSLIPHVGIGASLEEAYDDAFFGQEQLAAA